MLIFCQKYNSMFGDFGGRVNNQAFVSLATNNGYALGALVLGHSLRSVNTNRQLALMITPEVNIQVRQELLAIWDRLVMVDILDSEDTANLALLQRPDLGITFTKLQGWKLTEYVKCVFLDADTLVLQNIDDLFNRPEISAAPDIGWPDCFNTGVFVFVPSKQTYDALVAHALAVGSFDGGDQGLLNSFFNDWLFLGPEHRLPFVYNLHSNASYSYSPAFRRFGSNVKIVHFIGRKKPWQYSINLETGKVVHDYGIISVTSSEQFIQQWWDVYNEIAAHKVTEDVEHQTPTDHHHTDARQDRIDPSPLHFEYDTDDSECSGSSQDDHYYPATHPVNKRFRVNRRFRMNQWFKSLSRT
ncbi:glycogenin-1-like isoform X3 [Xenia sp. Carnegie-2017]|uniref:glycogenin-1-like isoform X3 n=1 Tax=Xenia sp. Carnegie-2017 TaxID=2897299 RepID=UPI001F04EAE4|nr:glycogenin-1-like isoform X3 [Xenia sp. Carnegie-2017]